MTRTVKTELHVPRLMDEGKQESGKRDKLWRQKKALTIGHKRWPLMFEMEFFIVIIWLYIVWLHFTQEEHTKWRITNTPQLQQTLCNLIRPNTPHGQTEQSQLHLPMMLFCSGYHELAIYLRRDKKYRSVSPELKTDPAAFPVYPCTQKWVRTAILHSARGSKMFEVDAVLKKAKSWRGRSSAEVNDYLCCCMLHKC